MEEEPKPKKNKWKALKYAESAPETLESLTMDILVILEKNIDRVFKVEELAEPKRREQGRQKILADIIKKLFTYTNNIKTLSLEILAIESKKIEESRRIAQERRDKARQERNKAKQQEEEQKVCIQ